MKKNFIALEILFLVLIIEILFLFTLLFLSNPVNIESFVLAGIGLFMIILAYNTNLVSSLVASAFFIFAYGTFLMLQLLNNPLTKLDFQNNYIWLILIPVLSATSGNLSDTLGRIKREALELSVKMDTLVTVDELTSFSNTKRFLEDLKTEMFRAKRHKVILTVMMIKIMYYDELLSLYGRTTSDQILRVVTDKIDNALRVEDSKYLVDNGIFAVIMPHTPAQGALVVKSRIKASIREVHSEGPQELKKLNFEVRIGVLEYDHELENPMEYKHMLESETEYDV